MTRTARELIAGVVVAAAAIAGMVFGAVAGDAEVHPQPAAGPATFTEGASHCSPPALPDGVTSSVMLSSVSDSPTTVGLEPRLIGHIRLPPGRVVRRGLPSSTTVNGIDVVGYGAQVPAAALFSYNSPVKGVAAATCLPGAAARWYLPAGTSALGTDENIVVYNPFSNDAAVRIGFYTRAGLVASANLSNVDVGARSSKTISIDKFAKPTDILGAVVTASRGRILVWSAVSYRTHSGREPGYTLIPGQPSPAATWFLPQGSIGPDAKESLTVLNPDEKEAEVNVSIIGDKGPLQTPKLVSVPVAPRSIHEFDLGNYLPKNDTDLGAMGVLVRSSNRVPVVAATTSFYSTSHLQGADSQVGVAAGARRAVAEPPVASPPDADSLVILNPATAVARIDITLQGPQGPLTAPKSLEGITVGPGSIRRVNLSGVTGRWPVAAVIDSSVPVVSSRIAKLNGAGDVSSVPGIPVSSKP